MTHHKPYILLQFNTLKQTCFILKKILFTFSFVFWSFIHY